MTDTPKQNEVFIGVDRPGPRRFFGVDIGERDVSVAVAGRFGGRMGTVFIDELAIGEATIGDLAARHNLGNSK